MRLALATLVVAAPSPVLAGAWPMPPGETQAIVKFDSLRAEAGYDLDGVLAPLPAPREDAALSLFVEHGLTDRLTLQLKGEWQSGRDAFVDYEGFGPTEIGLRWLAWSDERTAVSLHLGHVFAGAGRNAGYAAPGEGEGDWEARVLVGRSAEVRRLGGRTAFAEIQAARRFRQGLPDEARADLTVGLDLDARWTVLAQAYGGRALDDGEAVWLNGELSVVRRFGDWRLQAGWRHHLAGVETPAQSGPVVAVWRRF